MFSIKIDARSTPLLEILAIVLCVLAAEWIVLPLFGRNLWIGLIPVLVAFIIMLISHLARGESARGVGWRFDNFFRAILLLAGPMIFASFVLAGIGWLKGGFDARFPRPGSPLFSTVFWLFLWGLMQEYPLQGFINRRAQLLWGKGITSVLVVASVFAFLHLPNLWLTLATFCAGLLWATVYQRAPNLFAIGLSHCLMTIVLICTVPYSTLHGLRVGYNYFLKREKIEVQWRD
jgi:hypothetical protein